MAINKITRITATRRARLVQTALGFFLILALLLIIFSQPDIPLNQLKEKYAKHPSQFVEIMGMTVHYRDEGPPTIPLVLLHGTSSSLLTWDACTKGWTNEHRVIRMDLPGFGLTGPNPENDYSIEAYVAFLEKFLQERNVPQCYLAGNSLGGRIATNYAATYPGKVKKVILLDAAGYPIHDAKGSLGFTLARIPIVKNILTFITPLSLVRKSVEDVYGDKTRVTDALVEQYRDMTCREGNRKALLLRLNGDQKEDTTVVSKLTMPTLVIWGALDQVIPVSHAYQFHRDLPMDTLVVLPGVGHVPMEESPERVISLVNGFIDSNK